MKTSGAYTDSTFRPDSTFDPIESRLCESDPSGMANHIRFPSTQSDLETPNE